MAHTIVVGVDGSAESMAAAHWGAREAQLSNLPVRLVHAWGWHPQLPAPLDVAAKSRAERTVDQACGALEAAYPDLVITTDMPMEPADAALLARAGKAELLVLGSRGHSAISGSLLGSVGQQVLARAGCPVALVRAQEHGADDGPPGDVVVGLQDVHRPAQPLLRFAFTAAQRRHATVRIVHAWNLPSDTRCGGRPVRRADGDGATAVWQEKALAVAVRPWRRRIPRLRIVEETVRGDAGEILADNASGACLVVVGRKTHHPVLGMRIGPVTHDVIHHVRAPVVVVPHD